MSIRGSEGSMRGLGFRVQGLGFRVIRGSEGSMTYLWLVGNGRMVVLVAIIVPHSSIPY